MPQNPDVIVIGAGVVGAATALSLTNGAVGIKYPSSRNTNGTNYVIFRPHSVSNVRADKNFTVTWKKGEPQKYTVTEI